MATVLVVDDEANIRELVSLYLTAAGYKVETAPDGALALVLFREAAPDLVVLDIGLPGMSGAEVCSAIREMSDVPIVMLTARGGDMDKVAMLEAGADDYVVKPFSPPELVARVRAVLRRTAEKPASVTASGAGGIAAVGAGVGVSADAGAPAAGVGAAAATDAPTAGATTADAPTAGRTTAGATVVVRVGGLALDPESRDVTVDDAPIALTAREFDLLLAMARRPGVVFSREQLLESAVGFADYTEARGVDVHVRHLREKLGDDAANPRFLETVRGVGYRVKRDAT